MTAIENKELQQLKLLTKAFVFINVDSSVEKETLARLRALSEVKELYSVYGLYDVVAVLETHSMGKLKEAVTQKVRTVDGVKSTITTILV